MFGFDKDELWGIVTFSGTDGNNHGLYFGSKHLEKKTGKKPVVYVSDAAHYSGMRLADMQNLDLALIPADAHGCMIPQELDRALAEDRPALFGGYIPYTQYRDVLDRRIRPFDSIAFSGHMPAM